MTIVDTNILLDIVSDDPVWFDWSARALEIASAQSDLVINAVVYAELSSRYSSMENLDEFIQGIGLQITPIPKRALFLADKAFANYRQSGGTKSGVLPDFFIGAHAAVADVPLLTRDKRRFGTYFPTVRLISPE